ncbi:MAG: DUF4190 domain-containing protein [Planctomycetota bacterium]
MTQYTQSGAGEYFYDEPEKTSILAILSLILGLICFVPLLGVLAIVLGVFALIGIGSSQGRTKGTGLAVAGIVLGLLFSVLQTGALFAAQQGLAKFGQFANPLVEVEAGSYDEARKYLATDTANELTDDDFEEFRDAYQAELGSFDSVPKGLVALIGTYSELGPSMNAVSTNDAPYSGASFPIPGLFDNSSAIIMLAIDESGGIGPNEFPLAENIGVVLPDGSLLWLAETEGEEAEATEAGTEGADEAEAAGSEAATPETPEPPSEPDPDPELELEAGGDADADAEDAG